MNECGSGRPVSAKSPARRLVAGVCLCLALASAPGTAAETVELAVPSGAAIVSQRYPADGPDLVLWFTGQYGRVEAEHAAAVDLAAHGVETWVTDFYVPYFLPLLPSSVEQVPDADLAAWLAAVQGRHPGRRLVLVAPGHLAALALRAGQASAAAGALLLFPLLYRDVQPGELPEYDPVVDRTRLDIVVLQPKSAAGYWWRERLKERLEAAGSRVRIRVLDGLRDGFYRRGDASDQEIAAGGRLGAILLDGLRSLPAMPGQ